MLTIDGFLHHASEVNGYKDKAHFVSVIDYPCRGLKCEDCPFSYKDEDKTRFGDGNGECNNDLRASQASAELFNKYSLRKKLELI